MHNFGPKSSSDFVSSHTHIKYVNKEKSHNSEGIVLILLFT